MRRTLLPGRRMLLVQTHKNDRRIGYRVARQHVRKVFSSAGDHRLIRSLRLGHDGHVDPVCVRVTDLSC